MRKMTLQQWLEREGLRPVDFAQLVSTDQATVSRWRRGITIPRPEDMLRIYEATKGQVDPNSFYDLPRVA